MMKNIKFTREILLTVFLSLTISIGFSNGLKAESLDDFLQSNGVSTNLEAISARIQFFLDSRYRKKEIFWYAGSIIAANGEQFDKLQLKFNTVSNAVYLKHDNHFYRINSSALSGFILFDEGQTRHFQKGYSGAYEHTITATINDDIFPRLQHVSRYEDSDELSVLMFYASEISPGQGELTVQLRAKGIEPIYKFQRYLKQDEGISNVEITSLIPDFDENTFLELKVIGNSGNFLKLNFKRSSHGNNMTQIKQTDVNIYDEHIYYISNRKKEIQEVQFSKKSIKKALNFAVVKIPRDVPSFRNEKQLASWLKKIL